MNKIQLFCLINKLIKNLDLLDYNLSNNEI